MKLLFENWQNFLKEQQQTIVQKPKPETDEYAAPYEYEYEHPQEYSREKYFGKNPDELNCVMDLRTSNPQEGIHHTDFYRCMERAGYTKLGSGAFRAVFNVPENPELVLKIVEPVNLSLSDKKRSMKMNQKEAKGKFQTASDLVPKVYDSARDYFWIISEKVNEITSWEEMQQFFPVWKDEPVEDFQYWFQKLINTKTIPEVAAERINKRAEYKISYGDGEELVNDPLILKIKDFLAQFQLPAWDIRPYNVGYVVRNGQKQFVILDPGFELGKRTGTVKGHTPKPGRGISAIFDDDKKYVKTWEPPQKQGGTAPAKPNIMENWRGLVKGSRGAKHFHYKIIQSSKEIVIQPLNLRTKEPEPGKVEGNAKVVLKKRTNIPHWQLAWSNSPMGSEGVGTVLYLLALELAGNDGLSPDDIETNKDAKRVWAKFMPKKNIYNVSKQKKEQFAYDNDENPFFFVFFKPKKTVLGEYSKQISYEQGQEEEKPRIEPEERP